MRSTGLIEWKVEEMDVLLFDATITRGISCLSFANEALDFANVVVVRVTCFLFRQELIDAILKSNISKSLIK